MSRVLKYKPEFNKEELLSLEKAFKLFADRDGTMNLNNMVIAMKELKFDQSEPVVYDIISEIEAQIEEKGARADKLRFGKKLYIQCFLDEFSVLCSEISDLQDELMEFQDRLNKLEEKYNNLKYGGEDDETLLDDYSMNDYI